MKIQPLSDRVVVQSQDAEEQTASGLYIPDTAKEKPQRGVVLAVGPGRVENGNKIAMTVKPGDTVSVRQVLRNRGHTRRHRVHDYARE